MGRTEFRAGRIAGVEVRIGMGLVLLGAFFTVALALTQYPRAFPGHGTGTYWLISATTTVLFVASILAHELGHAVAAHAEQVEVEGITLWVFGGFARLAAPPPTAGGEARIALSGPAATGLCAGLFWLLALITRPEDRPSMLATMFAWLSQTNLLLLVLNLLPALPLDGGRVVHAAVWQATGDRETGQTVASRFGWVVGAVLAVLAFRWVTGGRIEGLWALLIAVIVFGAAQDHERTRKVRRWWRSRSVGEVMRLDPPVLDAWMNIDAVLTNLDAHPGRHLHDLLPVRGADGLTLGVLPVAAARSVEPDRRRAVRAVDLIVPTARRPVVRDHEGLEAVIALHPEVLASGVVVTDHRGRAVGVLGPGDLVPGGLAGRR